MKYQAYAEYKDSGVEWLGDVPEHWDVVRLKNILQCRVTDGPHTTPVFVDEGVPFLSVDGIQDGELKFDGCRYISETNHDEYRIKALPKKNDLLMGKAASTGKIARVKVDFEFSIWSPLALIRLDCTESNPTFFEQSLKSPIVQAQIENLCTANTQKNISMDDIPKLILTRPPLKEQTIIANFLDHETAKIDTLIEKQQQLIKLLKEKRQAVISHAVTKGLNPNAPMRDSGVEWLGEVPEHWVVRHLKHTSNLQSGIPKGKDLTGKVSISVPMLRVANVQDGYLDLTDVHEMAIEPEQLQRYSLEDGDVLMNEGGDNDKLGRGAVWKSEIVPCIHQNHVFAIRPYSIEPEWLDLLTRASYAKFYFFLVAKQSTNLASISSTNIKETPLLIPPEAERLEIRRYVSRRLDVFENIESKCSAQIELMQERRTALISAAVTGKIDVRNYPATGV